MITICSMNNPTIRQVIHNSKNGKAARFDAVFNIDPRVVNEPNEPQSLTPLMPKTADQLQAIASGEQIINGQAKAQFYNEYAPNILSQISTRTRDRRGDTSIQPDRADAQDWLRFLAIMDKRGKQIALTTYENIEDVDPTKNYKKDNPELTHVRIITGLLQGCGCDVRKTIDGKTRTKMQDCTSFYKALKLAFGTPDYSKGFDRGQEAEDRFSDIIHQEQTQEQMQK